MTPHDPKKDRPPRHRYVDVSLEQALLWAGLAFAITLFAIQVPTYISLALVLVVGLVFTVLVYRRPH